MKKTGIVVLILLVSALTLPMTFATYKITKGEVLYRTGHYLAGESVPTGFDVFGYNYQGHMFKGSYYNSYAGGAGYPPWTSDDTYAQVLEEAGSPTMVYTQVYPDIALSGGFEADYFPDVYDLTKGDMVIRFTYDGNGLVDDFGGNAHAWAELGIRAVGYSNFNPTWMEEGAGVWLATDYDWTANTFDPDPVGFPTLDLDDKLILQKGGGMGEGSYNLPSVPPSPGSNHRVWWDRDGVDPWQNDETANTGGIYEIELYLHADDDSTGTAYMKINGLWQGFETDGNWNTIELTPAGMTFTGDMKQMQVFYGLYGYGATHTVEFRDIEVDYYDYCAYSHWAYPYREVDLTMKWNDAWISNMDRDEDGELDRHWGYPSYADSGAWLTNHQSGVDEGENWVYFVKIVTPSPLRGDYVSGGYWYTSDDIEIGPVIWGAFAKVQTVDSKLGITYESPYSTSFSDYPAY
jgi:hypothetical protein